MGIGERIRNVRRAQGLSLSALARATSLSKGFLSQVESGASNPSLDSLRKLSSALGLSLAEMLVDSPAVTAEEPDRPQLRVLNAARPARSEQAPMPVASVAQGVVYYLLLRPEEGLFVGPSSASGAAEASVVLVSGTVLSSSAGRATVLKAGDLAVFDTRTGFEARAKSAGDTLLLLTVPEGATVRNLVPPTELSTLLTSKPAITGPFRLVAMRAERTLHKNTG